MSNERIVIKGTSEGLVITIGSGAWSGLVGELDQILGEKASFFKGGRVALRVGPRQLSRVQLESVGHVLSRHQVSLWAVETASPATEQAATELGLETISLSSPKPRGTRRLQSLENDTMFVQRTLRSGQVIHHSGHVVIIGDVNPGAEIRAGGSVIVWGRLRGLVQAGFNNPKAARKMIVCALEMSPTQLRIGDQIARPPTSDEEPELVPEIASIQNGRIVAEPWK